MKLFLNITILLSIILIQSEYAFAYLDPGTGSMILQSIIAGFLFVGTAVGLFWQKIKNLFSSSKKNNTEEE